MQLKKQLNFHIPGNKLLLQLKGEKKIGILNWDLYMTLVDHQEFNKWDT